MRSTRLRTTLPLLFLLLAPMPRALAQGGPPPEVRRAIDALLLAIEGDDAVVAGFLDERLALPEGVDGRARMEAIRDAAGGRTGDVSVEAVPDGLRLTIDDRVTVGLALDDEGRFTRLELLDVSPPVEADPVGWDDLDGRLREAEAEGWFSGVVQARRGGEVVLRETYGEADRERGRPTALDSVYGIGSAPIDFTVAATYLLAERGVLDLDDPIGRFVPGVPADKRSMTIRMILEGRSGLPDFHDVPGDRDPDLAWIDRETALGRILSAPLLFAPGTDRAHSHSAYGLLSAIVELASGRTYADFVRSELFDPIGMERTGFYGETLGLDLDDFAVGYGESAVGLPNIPPNWGPTSWLVLGSGGMFSTLDDMDRFYAAVADPGLLGEAGARRFSGETFEVGGSARGYFILRLANEEGDQILMLMNGEGRATEARALTRALADLVLADG